MSERTWLKDYTKYLIAFEFRGDSIDKVLFINMVLTSPPIIILLNNYVHEFYEHNSSGNKFTVIQRIHRELHVCVYTTLRPFLNFNMYPINID